jgi:hypothetical protein
MEQKPLIRRIYLYTFAFVGLLLVIIGGVRLVNLGLRALIFTKADVFYDYPSPKPITAPAKGEEMTQPNEEEVAAFQRNQTTSRRERDAAGALAMIVIGAPLYLYHWRLTKNGDYSAT